MLPPQANADSVCAPEDVPEVYCRPYDPRSPVVGVGGASKRLAADVRPPLPAAAGQPQRVGYECQRRGTADLFMAFEPLAGRRHVAVTERRTEADFAHLLRRAAGEWYPQAEVITLGVDDLNARRPAVRYEVLAPAEARRPLGRLEFVYTAKHASGLNAAELGLSALARQGLDRRPPGLEAWRR